MPWNYDANTGQPVWEDDSPQESPVPDVAFEPVQQPEIQFTEEEADAASTIPSEIQFSEDEVPTYGQTQVAAGESHGRTTSNSQSDSKTYFNDNTFQTLETTGKKGIARDMGHAYNKATAQANELYSPFEAAAQEEANATAAIGKLQADKATAEAQFTGQLAQHQADMATFAQNEYAKAQAKTQEYMSQYEVQLKELSAMSVNPGRLYSSMSKGTKAGTLVTAFVQDFLGSRGVKTSGMDYINQAIDRDIDAQVQNIANKRAVVGEFGRLYEMQRQQSQSDYEAKLRMKGMMLEAFKTEVAGKLGQYDSDIARAQIPLALAKIDQELASTKMGIAKFRNDVYNEEANRMVSIRGQNMSASIAREGHAVAKLNAQNDAKRLELQAAENARKAAAEERKDKQERVIRVPETRTVTDFKAVSPLPGVVLPAPTGQRQEKYGRVLGMADTKESAAELRPVVEASTKALTNLEKLRTMTKAQGGNWNIAGKIFTEDEAKAELNSIYEDMISDIALAKTGKAGNEQEYARLRAIIPQGDFQRGVTQTGDGGDIAAKVQAAWGLREIQARNDQLTARLQAPTAQDMRDFEGGTSGPAYQPQKVSNETFDRGTVNTPVDELIAKAGADRDRLHIEKVTPRVKASSLYQDAINYFDDTEEKKYLDGQWTGPGEGKTPLEKNQGVQYTNIPEWFASMSELKDTALSPDTSPAEKQKIVDYFTNYITNADANPDPEIGASAMYFLQQITPNINTGYSEAELEEKRRRGPNK